MRRLFVAALILLLLILSACANATPDEPAIAVMATATPLDVTATPVVAPSDTPFVFPTPEPTNTIAPLPTDTAIPASPTPQPGDTPTDEPIAVVDTTVTDDLSISAEQVSIYPVPVLYTGDRVTFQIRASIPDNINPNEVFVNILIDNQRVVSSMNIGGYTNLNGDAIGLYQWVWQPTVARDHTVRIELDPDDRLTDGDENPDNNIVEFDVAVTAKETLPDAISNARWETYETPYAKIHLITGTAAHRDRILLAEQVDSAVLEAAQAIGVPPIGDRKVEIYFIDRIIGQGGYAGSSMVISYVDRNYAGGGIYEVLVHESIHVLDDALESNDRLIFLVEGMAVWGTGGHYKREDLDSRAAGLLLDTDQYIPLDQLIDNFYPSQHEVGYLASGAFVKYLADTYGEDRLRDLYGSTQRRPGMSLSDSFSEDLVALFGKTLTQMEEDWHRHLQSVPRTASDAIDLELTIEFYDTMRRYQQAWDPTAYYLYAWLPYPDSVREQNLTADLARNSNEPINIALEAMLESADTAIRNGDYARARVLLDSVSRVLSNGGEFIDPLAASYFELVQKSAELGFIAQDISIFNDTDGSKAIVVASDRNTAELVTLTLALAGNEWTVSQ